MQSTVGHSRQPQRRIVRRASLWSRARAYPLDLFLSVNDSLSTVEWDKLAISLAALLGAGLDVLFMMCRLGVAVLGRGRSTNGGAVFASDDKLSRSAIAGDVLQGHGRSGRLALWFSGVLSILSMIIFTACVLNAYYVLTRRRTYTFFGRSNKDKKMENHAATRTSQLALESEAAQAGSPLQFFRKQQTQQSRQEGHQENWELRMWNPPLFNLYLCSTFSPFHALIILFTTPSHFLRDVIICLLVSLQTHVMIKLFLQLTNDKQLVYGETFEEYEQKVVRPKLSVVKREVAVGTDGSVDVYTPQLDRRFVTRDIRPSPTRSFGTTPIAPASINRSRQSLHSTPTPALRPSRKTLDPNNIAATWNS
ncbi:uncharacterized protein V1518DRAFT_388849 [Limtongia smithiae]|uniref:uncharacterized protein n=1 Tax=Limtongia smithiae TaxID=1125753 RepID=UPI0034CD1765